MTDRDDLEKGWARFQPSHDDATDDYVLPEKHLPVTESVDPDAFRPVKPLDEDGTEVDDEDIDAIRHGE